MRDPIRERRPRKAGTDRGAHVAHEGGVLREPHGDVDVLGAALRDRLRDAEIGQDRIRAAFAVPLADERHDRHAHVERLERAVDAAEGHRIEHEVDEFVARLVLFVVAPLRQEEHPLRRDARRGGDPGVDRTQRGRVGENASFARGMRASTSRHRARQRRDSLRPVTKAPMTIASAAMPSCAR